jgi:serine phosphatase RsbU (regulator of sigma subunit)
LLIAIADCTGHGVPGAFMSMIGNTLLNEIVNVKNISEPHQILNYLNKGVINNLHQNNSETNTQDDGMDITILAFDKTNNEITFAGANHFAYLFHNNELRTLMGDVFSIGGMFGKEDITFSSQKIKTEKGDTLYLFTDGFMDQFGGEKNSKFLSGRFAQLLQNIQHLDMLQQKEKLIAAFDDWKGNNKQLDDICVVGLKV